MVKQIKAVLRNSPLYQFYLAGRQRQELRDWEQKGSPLPPPSAYKQRTIREYARQFGIRTLVETGTFYGDTIFASLPFFDRIYSVELDTELHRRARARFERYPKVRLLRGDSGEEIAEVLSELKSPTLFWLDGHYSAGDTAKGNLETPIVAELSQVFTHPIKSHVILIDDARCFDGNNDYPTLSALKELVNKTRPDLSFALAGDIIRLTPVPGGHPS